jgi:hypothetical protein
MRSSSAAAHRRDPSPMGSRIGGVPRPRSALLEPSRMRSAPGARGGHGTGDLEWRRRRVRREVGWARVCVCVCVRLAFRGGVSRFIGFGCRITVGSRSDGVDSRGSRSRDAGREV